MDEAKARYENILDYTFLKMYESGLDPDEVTENYKRFRRETYPFDHLTGEVTSASLSKYWSTAKGRLTFWRYQLQQYQGFKADMPDINRYIIERLKEAINGK